MPRVQCFECDMPVVVDPNGRCPEGHDLGPVGERIEQSLGRNEPHPDEPEPWVAILESDEPAPSHDTEPRRAQPISVGPAPADEDAGGSTEGLLHELHALHGGGDVLTPDPAKTSAAPPDLQPNPPSTPRSTSPPADVGSDDLTTDLWDDWDAWEARSAQGGAGDEPGGDRSGPEDQHDHHNAADLDPTPSSADVDADVDADADVDESAPAPTPRRAPTLRTEESMDAIAELAALLDDDEPSRPASSRPSTASDTDDPVPSGDGLATVSRLPHRSPPEPDAPLPPPPPPPPADREDASEPGPVAASGESIDWTNFTAKGKKRRFGR